MALTCEILEQLAGEGGVKLMEAVEEEEDYSPAVIGRLRRLGDSDMVAGAIELVRGRRKAEAKFGDDGRWLGDVGGAEQASSLDVARYKAGRFEKAGIREVVDLCCGIGGDAIGLAEVGEVRVVDRSEGRVFMAKHNVREATGKGIEGKVMELEDGVYVERAFHIDPSRRMEGGRRVLSFEDYEPGPVYLRGLIEHAEDGVVKMGPGIAFEGLPEGEVEIVSRRGALVQGLLWTGRLAEVKRRATLLHGDGEVTSLVGTGEEEARLGEVGAYLYVPDGAVERAGLLGVLGEKLGVALIHPAVNLLTNGEVIESPWVRGYRVLEEMGYHYKRVKEWLVAHDGGVVEVKTRGKAVNPDEIGPRLNGEGEKAYTVFIYRLGKRLVAYITEQV